MQKLSVSINESFNTTKNELEVKPGFRFHKLEVLNWGTFNNNVWQIEPDGLNSLLTGDIGSGKSTLVDAITTLLVPHHKITYNKAAGAEGRERSILSYILGEYKNEKDSLTNTSKSVYLRNENSYSVLIGHFKNYVTGQDICLAQVFWLKNFKPEKFFVVANNVLTVKEHFTNFGKDILNLKKELKKLNNVEVLDSFSEYSSRFRNIFGVKSEKALDLFYQTVSMKSVGNLTEFVRNQMLEKFDVKSKIDELKKRFEDLNESHKAVQKAKEQLNKLIPLVEKADDYEKISKEITKLNICIDSLPYYFSKEKSTLLEDDMFIITKELERLDNRINTLKTELEDYRKQEVEISYMLKNNETGKRLEKIDEEIKQKTQVKNRKINNAKMYGSLARALGFPDSIDEETFFNSQNEVNNLEDNIKKEVQELTTERDIITVKLSQNRKTFRDFILEYESLKNRKTQIPDVNLNIRQIILNELGLSESDLPYVGELIRVKENEKDWEGSIEKLLHNFGLSLLVPEEHYKQVSSLVNNVNLGGRLVYYRVPSNINFRRAYNSSKDALISKVEIKPDSEFYDWIKNEIIEKYNYTCCETMDQFHREPYAITKQGQIKVKTRHEKDDRRGGFDRKFFILGWSNIEKIDAIRDEALIVEKSIKKNEDEMKNIEGKQEYLNHKRELIRDFMRFNDFSEINWNKEYQDIQGLMQEINEIENSSDEVKNLNDKLIKIREHEIKPREEELSQKLQYKGKNEQNLNEFNTQLGEYKNLLNDPDFSKYESNFELIKELITEDLEIHNIERVHNDLRSRLNKDKNLKSRVEQEIREDLINKMSNYKNDYPAETIEVDVSINSLPEFRKFSERIKADDLPKHEERFKRLLNEGAIQSIVLFKNQLEIYEKDIEDKIRDINKSLVEIDYNIGTYIFIDTHKTQDKQIRDFKDDLNSCLNTAFGEKDHYNEEKFREVKKILDRFNSGESDDLNWTNKVTDVRNWFTFTVSEKWREDNTEKEFYSDSSGKSGGQKEKLAYTILASALAYQFGLDWNDNSSKSFRFVVIDEAFGRGSDESTRYGLELFKKLNLQLLIVTPLQKINIIEDYINSVHFVSNQGGRILVRNLTKSEYKEEKIRFLNLTGASSSTNVAG